ncbi:MAG: tRNA uridine(34) 5-carboxymethylaminomethyl modification radical SAM/GNAT enzyme Elp3 [Candidatus Helarchaeota archaeon]|nr:tRNA uridine(34) 5-carboxymethylaminomethyl modification radical SAM/GNAT enzyme Elp3 [Candidatus Helarchaeota archaeon]
MVCREILNEILNGKVKNAKKLAQIKAKVCGKYKISKLPRNGDILEVATEEEREIVRPILKTKRVRTISGIAVVAVMAKPYPCPHGKCLYCPGGPDVGAPQSYTGREPATLRAIQNEFDPFRQVTNRLSQLKTIGHDIDKVELIIMGGTFLATPEDYQNWFVKRCLEAICQTETSSFSKVEQICEQSTRRNTGITIETRPDFCNQLYIDRMLDWGVTRVEIGVQNVRDDIYEFVKRGHKVEDVIKATQLLKDSGLKVVYHMMPGMPLSDPQKDLDAFTTIFTDPNFKPDELKIYPTLVIKGTELYDMWMKEEYKPYTTDEVVKLLVGVWKKFPKWIRIQRVQRDIPVQLIDAGPNKSNLREFIHAELKKKNLNCHCIRCREVGHVKLKFDKDPDPDEIDLVVEKYPASNGEELFISYEDLSQDILIGFVRLRIPSEHAYRPEIIALPSALVRQLHVYGPLAPFKLEKPERDMWQHKGYGLQLLQTAERVATEEYDCKKILVTSGIGVREYYYRVGYARDGPYVSKLL